MTTLTNDQIDKMTKPELRTACKARGIKFGKMSLMQQRDALKQNKDDPTAKAKGKAEKKDRKARTGTKMEKAIAIVKANSSLPRKAIIAKFMSDVKLTKAGASTYWALIQKKLK